MSEQNYGWARVIPFTCAHFFPPPRTGEHNAVRVAFCGKASRAIEPAQFLSAEQCATTELCNECQIVRATAHTLAAEIVQRLKQGDRRMRWLHATACVLLCLLLSACEPPQQPANTRNLEPAPTPAPTSNYDPDLAPLPAPTNRNGDPDPYPLVEPQFPRSYPRRTNTPKQHDPASYERGSVAPPEEK